MQFYGEISRIDEEQRMVWGYASTEQKAMDGMVIKREALEGALEDYMAFANIREMHGMSAVGRADEGFVDDKGLYIGAKIVDDSAWKKVCERVYKGFSIKGPITARDSVDRSIVTGLNIIEISLVDRPSDPGAVFDVWRRAPDEPEDTGMTVKTDDEIQRDAQAPAAEDTAADVTADPAGESAPAGEAAPEAEGAERAATAEAPGGEDTSAEAALPGDDLERSDPDPVPADDAVSASVAAADAAAAAASALIARHAEGTSPVERAVAATSEVTRSIYTVGRLGEILQSLVYVIFSADYRAEEAKTNSTVPAKLRGALRALADAFLQMNEEEVADLLKQAGVTRSAEVVGLLLTMQEGIERSAEVTGLSDEETAAVGSLLAVAVERGFTVPAEAQAVPEELARVTGERDILQRSLDGLTGTVTSLVERMAALEDSPVPPKTGLVGASPVVVDKTADAGGQGATLERAAEISLEDVGQALAAMPEEDRALLLIRAAHKHPVPVSR